MIFSLYSYLLNYQLNCYYNNKHVVFIPIYRSCTLFLVRHNIWITQMQRSLNNTHYRHVISATSANFTLPRKPPAHSPQIIGGIGKRGDGCMCTEVGVTRERACQSNSGTEMIGQNRQGYCMPMKIWRYLIPQTKEFLAPGALLFLNPSTHPCCLHGHMACKPHMQLGTQSKLA